MTVRYSPTINDGGMWSGGHSGAWWDYPTPLGTPKQQLPYGACYLDRMAPNGEAFAQPAPCGIWWPWSEHKLNSGKGYLE